MDIGLLSLSKLRNYIASSLKEEPWRDFEVETLLYEFRPGVTPLLRDKVSLIKIMELEPELFYKDPVFFIYAVNVINNNVADFTIVPHITTLEVAFAIEEVAATLKYEVDNSPHFSTGVRLVIEHCLTEEGYSSVPYPLSIVGKLKVTPGNTTQDIANKERAIKEYINGMRNQSAN